MCRAAAVGAVGMVHGVGEHDAVGTGIGGIERVADAGGGPDEPVGHIATHGVVTPDRRRRISRQPGDERRAEDDVGTERLHDPVDVLPVPALLQ